MHGGTRGSNGVLLHLHHVQTDVARQIWQRSQQHQQRRRQQEGGAGSAESGGGSGGEEDADVYLALLRVYLQQEQGEQQGGAPPRWVDEGGCGSVASFGWCMPHHVGAPYHHPINKLTHRQTNEPQNRTHNKKTGGWPFWSATPRASTPCVS